MRVVVIGAGAAGCSAAHRLRTLGHSVIVLERQERVGGRAWSVRHGAFTLAPGADIILSFYESTLRLLDEIGQSDALVDMRRLSALHDGVRLHVTAPWHGLGLPPLGVLGRRESARALAGLAWTLARWRVDLFEPDSLLRADRGETIAAWARRTVGAPAYDRVVRPLIEARWYFSCEDAAAPLGMGLLRQAATARFYAVAGGMSSVWQRLTDGIDVWTGAHVLEVTPRAGGVTVAAGPAGIHEADAAVIATDASCAARLLGAGPAQRELAAVPYARTIRVILGYEHDPWRAQRAKAVFPATRRADGVAGIALSSGLSRSWLPPGGEMAQVNFRDDASRRLSDREAVAVASRALAELFELDPGPASFERVFRCDPGLPLPRPAHYGRMREVRDSMSPRVRLAGDYHATPSVEGAVRSGERAALELHRALA